LKVSELSNTLELLKTNYPKGLGVFSISKEADIEPQTLREYRSKYNGYFVQLPNEQSYQINRFGKFKDSTQEMILDYENELKAKKSNSNWLLYLLFIAASMSLSAYSVWNLSNKLYKRDK
jgi:hypothetical protein